MDANYVRVARAVRQKHGIPVHKKTGSVSALEGVLPLLAEFRYHGYSQVAAYDFVKQVGIDVSYAWMCQWMNKRIGVDSGPGSKAAAIIQEAVDKAGFESEGFIPRTTTISAFGMDAATGTDVEVASLPTTSLAEPKNGLVSSTKIPILVAKPTHQSDGGVAPHESAGEKNLSADKAAAPSTARTVESPSHTLCDSAIDGSAAKPTRNGLPMPATPVCEAASQRSQAQVRSSVPPASSLAHEGQSKDAPPRKDISLAGQPGGPAIESIVVSPARNADMGSVSRGGDAVASSVSASVAGVPHARSADVETKEARTRRLTAAGLAAQKERSADNPVTRISDRQQMDERSKQ